MSEAYRLQYERENRFRALSYDEQVRAWIERAEIAPRTLPFQPSDRQYMRLSTDGSEIETSNGATVPTAHVKRIAPLILRLIRSGSAFDAQDAPGNVRIGHFALSSIDAEGTVKVGCHTFSRDEIERIASLLDSIPDA